MKQSEEEQCRCDTEDTYTIAPTPRQYLSHIDRKRGCPPISKQSNRGLNLYFELAEIQKGAYPITLLSMKRKFDQSSWNGGMEREKDHILHRLSSLPFCQRTYSKKYISSVSPVHSRTSPSIKTRPTLSQIESNCSHKVVITMSRWSSVILLSTMTKLTSRYHLFREFPRDQYIH